MEITNRANDSRRRGPRMIPLEDLRSHPLNANVMSEDFREKLKAHVKRTGRYPYIVVRPHPEEVGAYEILDGHHRIEVLRDLGYPDARCDIWNVDDREAKLLLATLNRLQGQDSPIRRYDVQLRVIDALPEIHATREIATRHRGRVYLNYFLESQRGSTKWNHDERIVQENRTEALDASRQAIREGKVLLPRGGAVVQEFAEHMAADVKQLVEDEDTGAKSFRYVRTSVDHYSLAFTYGMGPAVGEEGEAATILTIPTCPRVRAVSPVTTLSVPRPNQRRLCETC